MTPEEEKQRKKAERKQRIMTRVANRTFSKDPNVLDRMAMKMVQKAAGPPEDDPELDHDGEIRAFED